MYGKWTDRIADKLRDIGDRLNLSKETWAHIGMAVGIAILISAVILLTTTPRLSTYKSDINRLNTITTTTAEELDDILGLGTLATDKDIDSLNSTIADHAGHISTLKSRMNNADSRINALANDIDKLMICSPPDAYLTGAFGNYTLHIESNKAGNFTANVHLVYSPPIAVGNATTQDEAINKFYASINWTVPTIRTYVPSASYNGTAWGINKVSFNIGAFNLGANTKTDIDIIFGGLPSVYDPSFAYVDIYPVHE